MELFLSRFINTSLVLLTKKSMADRLETATLNTILGMGTVFVVLILITILISLFKYIPDGTKKSVVTKPIENPVDNIISQITEQEENEMNDLELIAVITAAISASMNTTSPENGFVVRSIRKIHSR